MTRCGWLNISQVKQIAPSSQISSYSSSVLQGVATLLPSAQSSPPRQKMLNPGTESVKFKKFLIKLTHGFRSSPKIKTSYYSDRFRRAYAWVRMYRNDRACINAYFSGIYGCCRDNARR